MTDEIIRVAVVAADSVEQQELASLVEGVTDLFLVTVAEPDSQGIAQVEESRAQVVLVGRSPGEEETWAVCQGLKSGHEDRAVVKVVDQLASEVFRRGVQAGVKDLIKAPVSREDLAEAVYRAFDALERDRNGDDDEPLANGRGKVITVFSTKGGWARPPYPPTWRCSWPGRARRRPFWTWTSLPATSPWPWTWSPAGAWRNWPRRSPGWTWTCWKAIWSATSRG